MIPYRIQEGDLPIPADWRDQTINVFKIPGTSGARDASFIISRDPDRGMKSFDDYVAQQLKHCGTNLPRFSLKKNERLAYQDCRGAWLEYTWQQDKVELYLRQVFYDRGPQILICTLTTTADDLPAHDPAWRKVMVGMKLLPLIEKADQAPAFPPLRPPV